MAHLYHYTDSARLPWILHAGELRPGSNRIGGFPEPDFLWATSDVRGDRTASAHLGQHWRSGHLWHVRFVLDEADFTRWTDARHDLPGWTPDHIQRLEAAKDAAPTSWWFRHAPHPLCDDQQVEFRSYTSKTWRLLTFSRPTDMLDGRMFILVDNTKAFVSTRHAGVGPGGSDAYEVG